MKKRVIIAAVLIAIGGVAANYLRYVRPEPDRWPVFSDMPYESAVYTGEERRFDAASYEVLQADTTTLRVYRDTAGSPLWLFVGDFRSQEYGSQIHSPRQCLPGGGWRIGEIEPYDLRLAGESIKKVNRLIITEGDNRQLMLYWFETRGGTIRDEFALKWDLMKNSLMLRPSDAAFIRLNLPIPPGEDVETATRTALAWLDDFYPALERALPFAN